MDVRKKESIKYECSLPIEMAKILLSDPFKVVRVFVEPNPFVQKLILVRRFIPGQKYVET
jgi:hypothetical protein